MDDVSVTIIGAGVIGLAIAAELSKSYPDLVVLERHDSFGRETSSRNSEVIHAGLYYPPGSLKSVLCMEGAELLYKYAGDNSVPHERIGKLVVASGQDGLDRLEAILANARENGVRDLRILAGDEVARMEPAVIADYALYSPNTGIVDSHRLMARLAAEAGSRGVLFSFGSEAGRIDRRDGGYEVLITGEDYRFRTRILINAAGLYADRVAELAGIDADAAGYRIRYCKGSYFSYSKQSPVKHLVYPLPHADLAGLGVHATLDLAGRLRFGPDAQYCDTLDYSVERSRIDSFYEGASGIIAGLDRDAFVPDMAGIRPKLSGPGVHDFIIRHEQDRGLPGLVNLVGMESPGLTASLAIAGRVAAIARDILG